MAFAEKYTTQALIDADKTGVEAKKIIISSDAFAQAEATAELKNTIEALRMSINMRSR